MITHLIELKDISFSYPNSIILDGCNLILNEGDFTFLMGPNGSGKTTLVKLMAGVLKPEKGDVFLGGHSLKSISKMDLAKQIAVVEQQSVYFFPFTVEEVVLMGRYAHSGGSFFETRDDLLKVEEVLEFTQVSGLRNRSVMTLSGGELKRVEIARALAQEARIIIFDEPTAFLDLKQQQKFYDLLVKLNVEQKISYLIVSHNLNFIRQYGNKIFFLNDANVKVLDDTCVLNNIDQLMRIYE